MAEGSDVDKAIRLLMGDFLRKKPYIMMEAKPDKGDVVIQRFRTITDARRYAKMNGIEDYSLWSELKLKRKSMRKTTTSFERSIGEDLSDDIDEDIDDDIDDDTDDEIDDDTDNKIDDELV